MPSSTRSSGSGNGVILKPLDVSTKKNAKKIKNGKSKKKSIKKKNNEKNDLSCCPNMNDSTTKQYSYERQHENETVEMNVRKNSIQNDTSRPNNPRQLLRKLSSFMKDEEGEKNQNSTRKHDQNSGFRNGDDKERKPRAVNSEKSSRQLLRKLSSLKENKKDRGVSKIQNMDSKSRKLLRKLSSFADEGTDAEQKTDTSCSNDSESKGGGGDIGDQGTSSMLMKLLIIM